MVLAKRLVRIGIQDTYAHGASHVSYLMKEYQIDAMALVRQIEELIKTRLHITEAELADVYLVPVHSEARAEAL